MGEESDELVFVDEDQADQSEPDIQQEWTVLIVDDEPDIHHVTKFAMADYTYSGHPLKFVSLYSESEAREWLAANPPAALILLDVVMERNDSGFHLVRFIRENLDNRLTQIILRTGQPGEAPEEEAIKKYDINDYKLKTELTREKLFSAVTFSLRSFRDLNTIDDMRLELATLNKSLENKVAKRTEELTDKNEELFRNLQDNRNLLRVISHDLNNYLSVVVISSRIALKSSDDKMKTTQLNRILKAAQSQSELVEHVIKLEASKLGKKSLNLEAVNLADILRMMKFTFEDKLLTKELTIQLDFTCNAEIQVLVDPVPFLNSVINNIISNAIKFSHHGGNIEVTISESNNDVVIEVRDHGVGIPKDILDSLYNIDAKTSRFGTEGEKGTGFGMPLVRSYLEQMYGSIHIESWTKEDSKDTGTLVKIKVKKA